VQATVCQLDLTLYTTAVHVPAAYIVIGQHCVTLSTTDVSLTSTHFVFSGAARYCYNLHTPQCSDHQSDLLLPRHANAAEAPNAQQACMAYLNVL
jgi:hypothetical protein